MVRWGSDDGWVEGCGRYITYVIYLLLADTLYILFSLVFFKIFFNIIIFYFCLGIFYHWVLMIFIYFFFTLT